VEGNDPGHGWVCEGDRACVGVSHGMVEVKLLCFSQIFSRINTPTFLKHSSSSHLPACEDETEYSETLAYKIQPLRNHPEDSI